MSLKKEYVPTLVRFDAEGAMTPVSFQLNDKWWKIDKVHEVRRMPFQTGGAGVRYTIRVGRQTGFIMYDAFIEPVQWFVEVEENAEAPRG